MTSPGLFSLTYWAYNRKPLLLTTVGVWNLKNQSTVVGSMVLRYRKYDRKPGYFSLRVSNSSLLFCLRLSNATLNLWDHPTLDGVGADTEDLWKKQQPLFAKKWNLAQLMQQCIAAPSWDTLHWQTTYMKVHIHCRTLWTDDKMTNNFPEL